jgi:hypothetical protein
LQFPRLSGQNGDGDRVYLPVDFEGDPSLVLIAFSWQQQSLVDAWTEFADRLVEEYDSFEYYKLHVVGRESGLHPPMMTGGLSPNPGSVDGGERTVVVHVNRQSFRRSLGLAGEATIYALLVDDEYVVRRAAGMLTRDIADGLQSLLEEWEDADSRWDVVGTPDAVEADGDDLPE